MSQPVAGPVRVPRLAEVQADPTLLTALPLDLLVELRRQVRHLDAELDAVITCLMTRGQKQLEPAEVVDVKVAAERLNTSKDSLYRKHRRLRLGYIDPLDGGLKFTEQELAEYVRRQKRA